MDARKLDFPDKSFHIIIDKGTLDAVAFCEEPEADIHQMLSEISR
jgi:hypothetical protein